MSTGTEATASARGLAFLAERQLPSGGFSLRYGFDVADGPTEPDDHTVFGTALIAHSLGFCRDGAVRPVLARAVEHLRAHMEPGGVWRHWTPSAPQYHVVAPDVDDTAYVSGVLRDNGVAVPDNRAVLLANRDRRGLFYTWFIARWPPPRSARLWAIAARRARHPLEGRKLWTTTPAFPSDVDGIVNANVLAYLGEGPHAAPVVARLTEVFRAGEEGRCDSWYRGPFTFYYAVTRTRLRGFDPIADELCARIRAAAAPDGRIGDGPLDTALAACALCNLGAEPELRERACDWLARVQAPDGSWPAAAFYYAGPREDPPLPRWGSPELTTGFCLEALARCRAT
ncbi:MAG TPA: hypothetical protein VGW75_11485 [Solirubrobacteraceae bacterium]|jgi:hypothetical protein|nr:hypothetical protein [Solirubrobacteraceae bacterium]